MAKKTGDTSDSGASDGTGGNATAPHPEERVLTGIAVARGVGFGRIQPVDTGGWNVPEYAIPEDGTEAESARLDAAIAKSRRQLGAMRRLRKRLPAAAAEELDDILGAHLQMVSGSRLVRDAHSRIEKELVNAEAAIQRSVEEVAKSFEAMGDAYLAARAEDVREVGRRVLRNLIRAPKNVFATLQPNSLVVGESFSPADTALMDPGRVAGFVTELGGVQSHTAIMARSLGLPAVLGVEEATTAVRGGQSAILDGNRGLLILDPAPATIKRYEAMLAEQREEQRHLRQLRDRPAETLDNVRIGLQANLELPREVDQALEAGAEGVGLFRTEFLFMNCDKPPSEEEQYDALATVVSGMKGRPVTIRTMDAGGEKLAYALPQGAGESPNPALGLRAIRLSLRHPKLLETQICAILRAGAHGLVRILLPMISSPGEIRQVRDCVKRMARRLARRRVPFADPLPPVGVMIEVPGAALAADSLAQLADFFAIGTNDLTQYTLAIDRTDEQVAHLYNPLHPGVLRLIELSVQSALRARIPVSVCGEMAGDPRYSALLLGLGVHELSMAATAIPRVKQRIRSLELSTATARANMVMATHDTGRIAMLLDDLNG